MSKHTVITASRYSFKDDSGKLVEGCKITYLENSPQTNEFKGQNAFTLNCPLETWQSLSQVPAAYEIEFGHKRGQGGKPALFINSLKFLTPVTA